MGLQRILTVREITWFTSRFVLGIVHTLLGDDGRRTRPGELS